MKKKKIFILERSCLDEIIRKILLRISESERLEILCYNENNCDDFHCYLPASFDAYIVHIPLSSKRALIKIKEKQPLSILYVRPTSLTTYVCPELRQISFGVYTVQDHEQIFEGLEKIISELGVLRK